MIACLASVANSDLLSLDGQLVADGSHRNTIPLADALIRRGLIKHKDPSKCDKGESPWSVTDEGWLVVELLKKAGLISQAVKSKEAA